MTNLAILHLQATKRPARGLAIRYSATIVLLEIGSGGVSYMGNVDRVSRGSIALALAAILIITYQAFIVAGAPYCLRFAPDIFCEIVFFVFENGVPKR